MPFAPAFVEIGESLFVDKLIALVHRDMKAYLDGWYLADALPDFAVLSLDEDTTFAYPLMAFWWEEMNSEESNGGHYLDQKLIIGCGLAVKDDSPDKVKRRAVKYIRAFKGLVRAAARNAPEDLLPDSSQILQCLVDIKHVWRKYGQAKDGTGYIQPIQFQLTYTFGEV